MWCQECRQDVPGIASSDGGFCCARCGGEAGRDPAAVPLTAEGPISDCGLDLSENDAPPVQLNDWETDDEQRHAKRVLRRSAALDATPSSESSKQYRFDPPQIDIAPWQAIEAHQRLAKQKKSSAASPRQGSNWLAWLTISLGLMALTCGVVLIGWSLVEDRGVLWKIGLPVTLAGQCALVLGLLLTLERLWKNSHSSQKKLEEVETRLTELNHQTAILGTTHSSASRSFYSHMAEGASPQILLADVKGQLDMLAVRMGK